MPKYTEHYDFRKYDDGAIDWGAGTRLNWDDLDEILKEQEIHFGEDPPGDPEVNKLWWNTTEQSLNRYNGTDWDAIAGGGGTLSTTAIAEENLNNSFVHIFKDGAIIKVEEADATDHTKPCNGYVEGEHNATDEVEVALSGVVNVPGVVAKDKYFLSTTAGEVTDTIPNIIGNIKQLVGIAVADDLLFLNIEQDFLIRGDHTGEAPEGGVIIHGNEAHDPDFAEEYDPRFPTTDEKDALDGTGIPSSTNKYVTNDDTRMTDDRDPNAHAASHKGGGADAIDAATTSVNGLMSSTDKTKLDDATNANTASKLVIRDVNARAQFADPSADQDAATKKYCTDTFGAKATAQAWTKAQTGTPVTLTDGANIAVDASAGNNFRVTLEGNRTLNNPTNLTDGWTFNIMVKQDATGSRTLAYGNKYAWAGGAPTLTTTASARDQITGIYWSTEDIIVCTIMKDVKVPS